MHLCIGGWKRDWTLRGEKLHGVTRGGRERKWSVWWQVLKSQNNSFVVCFLVLAQMSGWWCARSDLHAQCQEVTLEHFPFPVWSVSSSQAQRLQSPGVSTQLVGTKSPVPADNPFRGRCLISPQAWLFLQQAVIESYMSESWDDYS